MVELDALDTAFIVFAFGFQVVLIVHFALRRWAFATAMRFGWLVYALGILAAILSVVILLAGKELSYWLSGFLFLLWGIFGFSVEYVRHIQWRNPPRWSILIPYVVLYLATQMFYWFPLANLWRPLWFIYAGFFVLNTVLNITSHRGPKSQQSASA